MEQITRINAWFDSILERVTHYLMIVLVIVFAIVAIIVFSRIRKSHLSRKMRAKPTIARISGNKAGGLVYGRDLQKKKTVWYSPEWREGHVFVFGGSGSGKTAAFIIPTLLNWHGTCFVIDLAGDITKNTAWMTNRIVYDITDFDSPPYDVFYQIDREEDYRRQKLLFKELCLILIPQPKDTGDGANAYYARTARRILEAGMLILYDLDYDFIPLCRALHKNAFDQILVLIENKKDCDHYQEAHELISPLKYENERNVGGAVSHMHDCLEPFATNDYLEPTLRRWDGEDYTRITPSTCLHKNVIIRIPEEDLALYGAALNVMLQQIFYELKHARKENSQGDAKILFALDEFSAYGRMDMLDAMARLRKRNVRIALITQSMSDLRLNYSEAETKSMISNAREILIMDCTERDTQVYLADLIGKEYKKMTSRTRGATILTARETTMTDSLEKDYIIQPEELGRLGKTCILIHEAGFIRLWKNYYFDKIGKKFYPERAPVIDDESPSCERSYGDLYGYYERPQKKPGQLGGAPIDPLQIEEIDLAAFFEDEDPDSDPDG